MVLRCECGGVLKFEDQHYPENEEGQAVGIAYEKYRCVNCNKTGTYEFGEQNGRRIERMSGCVTSSYEGF